MTHERRCVCYSVLPRLEYNGADEFRRQIYPPDGIGVEPIALVGATVSSGGRSVGNP